MADKVVFVAFAMEDKTIRDFLKGQSINTKCPFEFVDMSVKEPYESEWKDKVRTRIKRSDGVLVLVSKNSLTSAGQKWEISCAKEEDKPLKGLKCYSDDTTDIPGVSKMIWTWENIANWIDTL